MYPSKVVKMYPNFFTPTGFQEVMSALNHETLGLRYAEDEADTAMGGALVGAAAATGWRHAYNVTTQGGCTSCTSCCDP
jgi:hypothetical protein